MKKVLVLDFGGQYNLLVARRVRECGVYCEIKSYRLSMEDIRAFAPDALILTGGPATVFEPNAPMVDKALFEMGIPVLGICYGQQLMMHRLGGQCRKAETREYGKIELTHIASPLFENVPETSVCWMSHGVEVERMAPGFRVIATTEGCGFAAVENAEKQLYGVQCWKTSCTAYAASAPSGPWRPIWTRPWRNAAARSAAAGCCWRCPAAWTALWRLRCCSAPWAIS